MTSPRRPPSALRAAFFALLPALFAPKPVPAQPPASGDPPAAASAPSAAPKEGERTKLGLNLRILLSNPIPAKEEYKFLYLRRRWLGSRPADVAAYEKVAGEFAEKGAYFSAVEILWWADKINKDPAKVEAFQKRMREWVKLAGPADKLTEEGVQMFQAGRPDDALDRFLQVVKDHPYCEKAHYQLANTHFLVYLARTANEKDPPPVETREKVFRIIFERVTYAIAIDPLLFDAHYLIGAAREIFPDDPEFSAKTQFLTDRAFKFREGVLPPMEEIEKGARDPELFISLGEAFETVGIPDYAVFSYQAALARGSKDSKPAERIRALAEKYFTEKKK